jgi:glycosyltransferase involved in cell wall biosynthesis
MNEFPLVSIIVPAYNCENYISETLLSLFEQDYPNIEIIVVNDGSTDGTLNLLKTYAEKVLLIDQVNTGVSGARNQGIQAARGEFISFCDSDDLWAPQKVSEQVNYFADHPNVAMVYCGWHVWKADNEGRFIVPKEFKSPVNPSEIDLSESGWIYHKLLLDCICLTSTVMLRKNIVSDIGVFDTDLACGEDYDYWLRISRITEIHKLKSKLVLYRSIQQSISHMPTQVHYEYRVLENAISRWGTTGPNGEQPIAGLLTKRFAQMQFDFGYLHFKFGDPKTATRSFWNAISLQPFWHLPWAYLTIGLWKLLKSKRKSKKYIFFK